MLKQRLINILLQLPLAQKAALLSSTLCFCASIILILASFQSDRQLILHSSQLLGDSLARQLASDASNPLVQGDKLSLQSLLNKIIKSPIIVSGAIYDVANRPLAAAGREPEDGQSLSASITFQDSIAGYAVITLDTTPLQQYASALGWQLVLLALLLSGLCYVLSLQPARYVSRLINDLAAIASLPAGKRSRNTRISYQGHDELQQLAKQLIAEPAAILAPNPPGKLRSQGRAVLAFHIVNLAELQQQHTTPELQQLFLDFEQRLKLISQLYNGVLSTHSSDSLCLSFDAIDDEDSYPFRALCCGYLMLQWQPQLPLLLRAGLALDNELDHGNSSSLQQQLQTQTVIARALAVATLDQQLVAEQQLYQHSSVKPRLSCSANNKQPPDNGATSTDGSRVIDALTPPYQTVLQQQLNSLQTKLQY
jgi:uncharacterized membrane protein affecting hemolysin expression